VAVHLSLATIILGRHINTRKDDVWKKCNEKYTYDNRRRPCGLTIPQHLGCFSGIQAADLGFFVH